MAPPLTTPPIGDTTAGGKTRIVNSHITTVLRDGRSILILRRCAPKNAFPLPGGFV